MLGLEHMHELGIAHGDLKGANVLLTENLSPLLCDFGLSRLLHIDRTSSDCRGLGSTRWMSPERLGSDEPRTFASDIYALGMTITEVSALLMIPTC